MFLCYVIVVRNLCKTFLLHVLVDQTLKDFFLLGRGELFQIFVEMVQTLLREPVTATTEHGNNIVCVGVGGGAVHFNVCGYIQFTQGSPTCTRNYHGQPQLLNV